MRRLISLLIIFIFFSKLAMSSITVDIEVNNTLSDIHEYGKRYNFEKHYIDSVTIENYITNSYYKIDDSFY